MGEAIRARIYEKFARDTGIMTFVHIIVALRSVVLLPIIAKTMDAASYDQPLSPGLQVSWP